MTPLLALLLHCSLVLVSFSAPIKPPSSQNSNFKSKVQDAQSLANKMLKNIHAVHKSCVRKTFTNDPVSLEYIRTTLAIPSAPKLAPISETHTLEMNLGRISDGLQLHQRLLEGVKEKLDCSGDITPLLAEISELNTHINKVQVLAGVSASTPSPSSVSVLSDLSKDDYNLNVGVHLLLEQLRAFAQDTEMNLGNISDGLQLHQRLLEGVKEKVDCSGDITPLLAEISELNTHINKVQVLAGVSASTPSPTSVSVLSDLSKDDYKLNVGVHLLLEQLRAFAQDTVRTLREIQHSNFHF